MIQSSPGDKRDLFAHKEAAPPSILPPTAASLLPTATAPDAPPGAPSQDYDFSSDSSTAGTDEGVGEPALV